MKVNNKRVLICDCEGTMALDAKALAKALGSDDLTINKQLCRAQIENFKDSAATGEPLLIACTQEAPLFLETLANNEMSIRFTNIRENAGWSRDGADATPKIAALLAEAALDIPSGKTVSMESDGEIIILGAGDVAIEAGKQLASRMNPMVLLSDGDDLNPPGRMEFPIFTGTVKSAKGYLGAFQVDLQNYAPATPWSRGRMEFDDSPQSGTSSCDIILDLRGRQPLFNAPEKRDGYFNPDPRNQADVQKAIFEIADLVGEFEKPRYIEVKESICAHSRNEQIGCTRCIDICPTSAITPAGDHIDVDPYICAGCGSCAGTCPTGAITYSLPAGELLLKRLRTVVGTYLDAGGIDATILVHDSEHGEDLIGMMARVGDGLPANVIPFSVNETTQVGLDFLLSVFAYGASQLRLLVAPQKREEADGLITQVDLAAHVLEGLGYDKDRIKVLDDADPSAVEEHLYAIDKFSQIVRGDFLPMGGKTTLIRSALQSLHDNAPRQVNEIELPAGAPIGGLEFNTEGCTLCMSCVGACPTGATQDNPDKPQLRFREDLCVQCGLCRTTCPENVITLKPRVSFKKNVADHQLVKEEEPFECTSCGKAFGTKSSIEKMIEKLSGHAMFADESRLALLRMCDNCRVVEQMHDTNQPFAMGKPRVPRTTDDYLREREELRQKAKKETGQLDSDED
ncbi:MAG: 4Fe-4S binding protein [Rhodospirillales bacterium]